MPPYVPWSHQTSLFLSLAPIIVGVCGVCAFVTVVFFVGAAPLAGRISAVTKLVARVRASGMDERLIALVEKELSKAHGGGLLTAILFALASPAALYLGISQLPFRPEPEEYAVYLVPGPALLFFALLLVLRKWRSARISSSPTHVALVERAGEPVSLSISYRKLWINTPDLAANLTGHRRLVKKGIAHISVSYHDGASYELRSFVDAESQSTVDVLTRMLPHATFLWGPTD